MAKKIVLSEEDIRGALRACAKRLLSGRISGKFEYDFGNVSKVDRKATLHVSTTAYIKMKRLVNKQPDEVGWHGIARRGDGDEYFIDDIMIYPQEVTGSTVTVDQNGYEEWLGALDDATFNALRFQGHSHVNMGCTPSSVDKNLYDGILSGLSDDDFYIFAIFNKKSERMINIYDMKKNVLFESQDISMVVDVLGQSLEEFDKVTKECIVKKPYTVYSQKNPSYGGGYNGGAYSGTKKKDNGGSTGKKYTGADVKNGHPYAGTVTPFDDDDDDNDFNMALSLFEFARGGKE